MQKHIVKILQDIISDARACSQSQVPETLAKSTLVSIADRLEDVITQGGA